MIGLDVLFLSTEIMRSFGRLATTLAATWIKVLHISSLDPAIPGQQAKLTAADEVD